MINSFLVKSYAETMLLTKNAKVELTNKIEKNAPKFDYYLYSDFEVSPT